MSCFNRGVSLRMFRRPRHPLNSFLAMQDFNAFKTFCRVAETAGKLLADKKPNTGRCLITGKNVSQTASVALPISGQEPHSAGELKACAGASNQPQTQPGLSPNLFPAHQFVVSNSKKIQWGDLTCPVGRARNTPALISISHRVMGIFIIVCIASTSHWEPAHTGSLLNQI